MGKGAAVIPDNIRDDGIIERHCTKENPWDLAPFNHAKMKIIHDEAEELYPDFDTSLVTYKCPNCGHVFTIDLGD